MTRSIRRAILVSTWCLGAIASGLAHAADTVYEYDALGRLITVTRPDGTKTSYTLDPAGNRKQVDELLGGATPPVSITVPSTSLTGSYSITWQAGSGTVTGYELYESTSSTFTTQTRVYQGAGTSASISGHGNGKWYYRVRACNGSACTGYKAGGNGVTVTVPPNSPSSITFPMTSTTGTYTVSWGAASGTLTRYELFESTSASFAGEVSVYSGTARSKGMTGKTTGKYYYRVVACNVNACSAPREGADGIVVTIPPTAPTGISYPATSTSGTFSITWNASSGTVTAYEVYESTTSAFTTSTLVYSAPTPRSVTMNKGNGTFYYRVRACNSSQCSGYNAGSAIVVTLPPSTPGTLNVPTTNNTGTYTISWGGSSGTLTAYELYESTSSTFATEVRVYNSTGISTSISGKGNGTYYYRLRACNQGSCSGYAPGPYTIVVPVAPSAPASVTVPQTTAASSYNVNWQPAPSGNVTAYELYESTSSSFSTQTSVYSGTGTSATITGRTTGTYYYRARACNSSQCSGYTAGGNGIVVDQSAPTAPTNLGFSVSGTNVTATFNASSDNVGVAGYDYRLNSASQWTTSGTVTSIGLSGLTSSTTYTFEVRARDAVGNNSVGTTGSFTTGPPIPLQPTGLSYNQVADCAWAASWSATQYATYYRFSDTSSNVSDISGTSTTVNCPVGNPSANKPKSVQACNATGCSSAALFGAAVDNTPPTPPGAPQFSNLTSTSVTATWTASFDFSGISNYQYNYGRGWVDIGSTPNVSLTGLSPSTGYTLQVRARDNAGLYGSASSAAFTTPAAPDTTPPSAPGALTRGTTTATSVAITWNHATDNVGVTGYEYMLNSSGNWINLGYVTSATIAISGNTHYVLEVRARDGAGNTGSSASVVFDSPPAIPPQIAQSTLQKWNDSPFSWHAEWGSSAGATYYQFMDNAGIQTNVNGLFLNYQCSSGGSDCTTNRPKWVKACNNSGCSNRTDYP